MKGSESPTERLQSPVDFRVIRVVRCLGAKEQRIAAVAERQED